MIESAHGLILRTRPLTETSLIVNWLTPDLGRISTVAKGARRTKSNFAGKLDLFYAADFSFTRSRSSELHNLREVKLQETHGAIREDLLKLQQAAYAANFIVQATETEAPLPEIFELFQVFIQRLCVQPMKARDIFSYELKLLHELGLAPDWQDADLTAGAKKIVQLWLSTEGKAVSQLKLSQSQTGEIKQWLHGFLIFNLGKLPRGREAALG
jgi:DNA repair protein RecO (recombination protein O)